MKKRTSKMSRRIVSLLMSMVLTLTLVTPAAFATEVVDGSTPIVEGNANPAGTNTSGDSENKDDEDKNTEDGGDEQQPADPGDEGKNPDEGDGEDANKPAEDKKDEENPNGDKKDEENKDEQPAEDENNDEDDISLLNDENGTDVWVGAGAEGGIDTSWYNTNDKTFEIKTAAELAGLAKLVNEGTTDFDGKTIRLAADIDLGGKTWTPIGNSAKFKFAFKGVFYGQGHIVSNLNVPFTEPLTF